ncbi:MAG: hypothetical protein P8011_18230 [Acidihalobacter sp.]|uniref:hypothetical protein n=1 Tax=Acidihalobacter sp. TaxID=1872108 RepID=UPI00307D4DA8
MGEKGARMFQAFGILSRLGAEVMFGEPFGYLGFIQYADHEALPHTVPTVGRTGVFVYVALAFGIAEQEGADVHGTVRFRSFDGVAKVVVPLYDDALPGRACRFVRGYVYAVFVNVRHGETEKVAAA